MSFLPQIRQRRVGQTATALIPGAILLGFIFCVPIVTRAEAVRFEIHQRTDFADGQSFGNIGSYERIAGRVFFAIDPRLPQNRQVIDLQYAPPNGENQVEFSSELFILAPKDLNKANGAILYDVNNRGNKLALRFFNDAPGGNNATDAGNGFLMRSGYTVVWSGWNGEILPGNARLRLSAPIAVDKGQPITGRVRYEVMTNLDNKTRLNVNRDNHGAYRPTERGREAATLSWRLRPGEPRVPIPRNQFKLHVSDVDSSSTDTLPVVELELAAEFKKGYLYELIYEARDPLVHGLCFASVRDLMSAFKEGNCRDNPLLHNQQPVIKLAYGFGVSQSGRFLREMLYSGFNEDERGGKVFDGLIPHVAGGGLGSFNHRFAQPTAYVTQHQLHDWHTDRFPFTYDEQTDPFSGQRDAILRRAARADVSPKIFHTQSSTEYWTRAGSLVHTDPLGTQDASLSENVRIFALGGSQHGPGSYPPQRGIGQTLANAADYRPVLRALLVALDRWCRGGPGPRSVMPTIEQGTLVDAKQASTRFPAIPGIRYPEVIQQPFHLGLGGRWTAQGIIDNQPPEFIDSYKVLVPRCGTDGNEQGCLLPPEVAVPLATFAGWSLRNREAGAENELVGLIGSYIPLPLSDQQREATGDPRPSIETLYGSLESYLVRLESECKQLASQGFLLEEDIPRIVERQRNRATPLFEKLSATAPFD